MSSLSRPTERSRSSSSTSGRSRRLRQSSSLEITEHRTSCDEARTDADRADDAPAVKRDISPTTSPARRVAMSACALGAERCTTSRRSGSPRLGGPDRPAARVEPPKQHASHPGRVSPFLAVASSSSSSSSSSNSRFIIAAARMSSDMSTSSSRSSSSPAPPAPTTPPRSVTTSTSPDRMTNISSPFSPCLIRNSPRLNVRTTATDSSKNPRTRSYEMESATSRSEMSRETRGDLLRFSSSSSSSSESSSSSSSSSPASSSSRSSPSETEASSSSEPASTASRPASSETASASSSESASPATPPGGVPCASAPPLSAFAPSCGATLMCLTSRNWT
mmetsp:Transcript_8666/g.36311  ORF Transcript_8666/g.36311 Transcript_8666/m.36311 type:complete len:335 (-) Transcript_8666:1437-2441(-)